MKQIIKISAISLAIILCTNCAVKLPIAEVDLPDQYVYGNEFDLENSPLSELWWQNFQDTTLNHLMEQALLNNRSLAAAAASVEVSRYYIAVAKADYLPSLDFGTTIENIQEEGVITREYTIAPTLEWEISLFGKLRNTKRSALAAFWAKEWNYKGVILSLCSQVATSYFTLLQYERSLELARRSYSLRVQSTDLEDSLYHYGLSDGISLNGAKSLVYSAEVEVLKYENAFRLAALSLGVLLGENPQESPFNRYDATLLSSNPKFEIPISVPSTLLERRPDVMEKFYSMSQSAAAVGIARAERYPTIELTLSGGVFATTLEGLTSGNPLMWEVVGSITQPIFNFNKLKRNEQIARQEYIASVKLYEESVLAALSDVEKALTSISTTQAQLTSMIMLVNANKQVSESTNALYLNGMGNYMSYLEAEREYYSSQINLIELETQNYIDRINLIIALGGGF